MAGKDTVVLTIAGSDSGGGAGIQADLRTFNALGVWGVCAVTVVTAQNTKGVVESHYVPLKMVQAQLRALADDFDIEWVKTGVLGNEKIAGMVVRFAVKNGWNLVVDPVATAHTGGASLWEGSEKKWLRAYRDLILPRSFAVTPNVPEAEVLAGGKIESLEDAREAAQAPPP